MITPKQRKSMDTFLDDFYAESITAAQYLKESFAVNTGKSQIRNLENTVYTATRFSSILNFIKNQMGKDKQDKPTWTKRIGNLVVGDLLLRQLGVLASKAEDTIPADPERVLEAKLYLARGWAKQVATHFLYLTIGGGEDERD